MAEIGSYPSAESLTGSELLPVVQGGSVHKLTITALLAVLVDAAPATLDTLNELAQALGDDPNFATTVTNALAGKLAKASNLADIDDAAAARENLGAEPAGEYSQILEKTASATLALTDKGALVEMNVASANTLTVPPNSSVAFPVKSRIDLVQTGAGQTTVAAGSGVTIRSAGSKLKLTGQYSGASLVKRATDEWLLFGDLSA